MHKLIVFPPIVADVTKFNIIVSILCVEVYIRQQTLHK